MFNPQFHLPISIRINTQENNGTIPMNQLDLIKEERNKVRILLGSVCTICLKSPKKNMHFHHVKYVKGEKIHSDFNNWIRYNQYILPRIKKEPERFVLLCKTCHHLITILQYIKDDARFERLIDLAKKSRT